MLLFCPIIGLPYTVYVIAVSVINNLTSPWSIFWVRPLSDPMNSLYMQAMKTSSNYYSKYLKDLEFSICFNKSHRARLSGMYSHEKITTDLQSTEHMPSDSVHSSICRVIARVTFTDKKLWLPKSLLLSVRISFSIPSPLYIQFISVISSVSLWLLFQSHTKQSRTWADSRGLTRRTLDSNFTVTVNNNTGLESTW